MQTPRITWQTSPKLSKARYFMGANNVNGSIVIFGGSELSWPWTGISTVEAHTPPPSLKISRQGTSIALAWTGILQELDGPIGSPWRDVTPTPTSPWTVDPSHGSVMKCFRSRAP